MKIFFFLLGSLVFLWALLFSRPAARGGAPVAFASKDFECLLRAALHKQHGEPVYPRDLARIRCLHLTPCKASFSRWPRPDPCRGVQVLTSFSLEDLAHFPSLEQLHIMCMSLSGLDALARLPLSSLSLTLCFLGDADCAPLGALTGLTALDLSFNNLHDVSFLREMTALRSLSLAFNPLASAAPLRTLPHLKQLDLSMTDCADDN